MVGQVEEQPGNQGQEDNHKVGPGPFPAARQGVNRQGHGVGLAGDIPGQHQSGPELPQSPGKGQNRPGDNAFSGQGQDNPEERPPLRMPQGIGSIDEIGVHRLQGRPGRLDHQRQRHHVGGQDRGLPGEHDGPAGPLVYKPTQHAIASEQDNQIVAGDRGRQDQRQGQEDIQHFFAPKMPSGLKHRPSRSRSPGPGRWPGRPPAGKV